MESHFYRENLPFYLRSNSTQIKSSNLPIFPTPDIQRVALPAAEFQCRGDSAIQYHRQRVAPDVSVAGWRDFCRHSVSQASTSGTAEAGLKSRAAISAIQYHRHQRVAQRRALKAMIDGQPPFSITGINEWHTSPFIAVEVLYHRHSVSQASTSGTGSRSRGTCGGAAPPFSITGINEWHSKMGASSRRVVFRHSVSQASTSGTGFQCLAVLRGLPPFSITGINEWHRNARKSTREIRRRHSVSQASTSGTLEKNSAISILRAAIQYHRHQRVARSMGTQC